MMMDRQRTVAIGAGLIGLGLIWWLNLWWLLLPGALTAAGAAVYLQRRGGGRTIEAVQGALWLVGMALLFLLSFVWPGLLFLAGASALLRGREDRADALIQRTLGRVTRRAAPQPTYQQVQVTTQAPVVPSGQGVASVGETTRLKE